MREQRVVYSKTHRISGVPRTHTHIKRPRAQTLCKQTHSHPHTHTGIDAAGTPTQSPARCECEVCPSPTGCLSRELSNRSIQRKASRAGPHIELALELHHRLADHREHPRRQRRHRRTERPVLPAAGRVCWPLPDEQQRDERLQPLHSHTTKCGRKRRPEAEQRGGLADGLGHRALRRPPRGAEVEGVLGQCSSPSLCGTTATCTAVLCASMPPRQRRARRRLLTPPKRLPVRSLRNRPPRSCQSQGLQPKQYGWAQPLPHLRSSVHERLRHSTATLAHRMKSRTAPTAAATCSMP